MMHKARMATRPARPNARTASPDGAGGAQTRGLTKPVRMRESAGLDSFELPGDGRQLLVREWVYMAPCLAIAFIITGVISRSVPDGFTAALGLGAMIITALTALAMPLERRVLDRFWARYALLGVMVGMPMLLFGTALAGWALRGSVQAWHGPIGLLVAIGLIAGSILYRRLPSILTAQVFLWWGVSLVVGATEHFAILTIGTLSGIHFTRLQMRADDRRRAERRALEHAQKRAEMLLAEYEASSHGWFWETDRRGAVTYVSPQIEKLLGGRPKAGRPFTELFILNALGQEGERTLNFHLSARSSFADLAVRAATAEAEERWWSISGRPVHDEFGNFLGFRGSGSDLTEKKRSQEHAARLAHYDSLTQLANRFQMSDMLEKILGAQREEHRACAVFLLDLDRFKQVNDTMGHPAGDALLQQVAQRLKRTVDEAGRVGRLGGDEFQVIIPGRMSREDLAQMAQSVIDNLSQPYSIDGQRVVIGASVGIAITPGDGDTSEAIIRNADLALYAAKDGGRGRYHFYAEDLHSVAEERHQMEQDLRDAIAHGDLELYYQPIVETMTERITGFEALLRWNHPVHGWLSPARFVPIAEDAGLIAAIGEWALRTACHDLSKWPEPVRVAVNVSPLQFANPALPAIVTNALASAQVDPARLELEITESVFLNDDTSTDGMFRALKQVGVRLALDDFGTGYSSLGYLKNAPFDKIKIDQSFVRGATISGSRNGALIASIVSLAEALGMETTAEGVETLDELDLVRALGCSHVQGYIYEKALSAEAATERLRTGLAVVASGPRSARASRLTMLRKVVLEHGGERYDGTIRNISQSGALVEGLWNVPPGTEFNLHLSPGQIVKITARWSKDDRMGAEFAVPLPLDQEGRIAVQSAPRETREPMDLRKAG
jgi:diguanylate cyclase (GGDEF)-like protein/PAS domain S-box-containing protein